MKESNSFFDIGIGIIGAGRAGSSLASALHECGYKINFVIDNNNSRAAECAERVQAEISGTSLSKLSAAGLIIIAVPDEVIPETARKLADKPLIPESAIVAHISGVLPASALNPLAETGFRIASCHPCMILNYAAHNVFKGSTFALEGDSAAVELLRSIVETLGAEAVIMDPGQKPLYHAACCMASNYLVTLLHSTEEMLKGFGSKADLNMIMPLVRATLSNVERTGVEKGLTGPILRGDIRTIEIHLEAIEKICPSILPVYKTLGRATVDLAANSLTDPEKITALKEIFKQSGSEQHESGC